MLELFIDLRGTVGVDVSEALAPASTGFDGFTIVSWPSFVDVDADTGSDRFKGCGMSGGRIGAPVTTELVGLPSGSSIVTEAGTRSGSRNGSCDGLDASFETLVVDGLEISSGSMRDCTSSDDSVASVTMRPCFDSGVSGLGEFFSVSS